MGLWPLGSLGRTSRSPVSAVGRFPNRSSKSSKSSNPQHQSGVPRHECAHALAPFGKSTEQSWPMLRVPGSAVGYPAPLPQGRDERRTGADRPGRRRRRAVFSLRVDAAGDEDRQGRGQQPRRPGTAERIVWTATCGVRNASSRWREATYVTEQLDPASTAHPKALKSNRAHLGTADGIAYRAGRESPHNVGRTPIPARAPFTGGESNKRTARGRDPSSSRSGASP
jgi:hypothetical protein